MRKKLWSVLTESQKLDVLFETFGTYNVSNCILPSFNCKAIAAGMGYQPLKCVMNLVKGLGNPMMSHSVSNRGFTST